MLQMIAIVAALTTSSVPIPVNCQYRNDSVGNCKDAVSDWLRGNANRQSSSSSDVDHRVRTGRSTLQECFNCAMGGVESGTNKVIED
jgi:hypothetical protein